ncbi:uncharacterized protein LOC131947374 [Physella acuta]|uniref:uncharacterized protein LOC131947374 n=1 Tax=Physella acuta TaxID=109671 RepID=UPI0027DCCFA5|nr:uncharacterized protein LOC131947374 [Physella acuta]
MKFLVSVGCLNLLISAWTLIVAAEELENKCSNQAVMAAMGSCQEERQKLSAASQSNNTVELCSALQQYTECMGPKIEGCQGAAKVAFDVITSKYTSEPYNCQLRESSVARDERVDETNVKVQDPPVALPNKPTDHGDSKEEQNDSNHASLQHQKPITVDIVETTPHTTAKVGDSHSTTVATHDGTSHNVSHKKIFNPSDNSGPRQYSSTLLTLCLMAMFVSIVF